jgi:hypothetical protein
MLYMEIIIGCSEIHSKQKNALSRQKVEFFMLNLMVRQVTTGL